MDYSTGIYLEKRQPRKDGTFPVKLRFTIGIDSRFYGLGEYLTEKEFNLMMYGKRKPKHLTEIEDRLNAKRKQANEILKEPSNRTFEQFRSLFTKRGGIGDGNVIKYFDIYIEKLRSENRHGTAESYICSKTSLELFMGLKGLGFRDITVKWLKEYHYKMEKAEKKPATIGIYLRPLRCLFRQAIRNGIVNEAYYPFGAETDGKFQIKGKTNTKRPLTINEIQKLVDFNGNMIHEKYRDFFYLSYHLWGVNFKDLLTAKWNQFNRHTMTLKIVRAKTKRTVKNQREIEFKISGKFAAEIFEKYSNPNNQYIFDIVKTGDNDQEIHIKIKNFTRNCNQALKAIAKKIGINPNISAIYARHSAASHAHKSGASFAFIGKKYGHSSPVVTANYIESMEEEEEFSNVLTVEKNGVPKTESGTNDVQSTNNKGVPAVPYTVPSGTTKNLVDNE